MQKTLIEIQASAQQASAFLRQMANEDRLLLLCQMAQKEMSVSELSEATGVKQPTLSQQLGVLRSENLVSTRREGKHIYYHISDAKVLALLETLYQLFCADK